MKRIKIRIKPHRALIVLLALITLFSFNRPLFAKGSLPKRIKREKKIFFESQISPADKLFLDQLSLNFQYLSEINGYTLEVLDFLPSVNKLTHARFIKVLRGKAKRIIPELTGRKKSGQKVKCFIKKYLGNENNLKFTFKRLLMDYKEIKKLKSAFKDDFIENLPTAGIYRHYTLCLETLGYSPSEILERMIITCKNLAKAAEKYEIKKLKRILPGEIFFLERASSALENKLLNRLEHSQSGWGRDVILQIMNLVQQQITLTKDFSDSVLNKLTAIPTPDNPDLPDLKVISIGVASTDTIKVGDKVTLVVAIRNIGQLPAGSSKAKVIFPNGKAKVISIPKLAGGQTYLKTLKCKIGHAGENEFKVIANFNFKTWESNTLNNITKRALILQ